MRNFFINNFNGFLKKNDRKSYDTGFTLIELLCIIAILSLIIGVVYSSSLNVINKAKEKNYKININNVEKAAVNYALEYIDSLLWINVNGNNYSYKCIFVQELIETGYLKNSLLDSEVANNRKLNLNDSIYIAIDNNKKVILQSDLVYDDNDVLSSVCRNNNIS